MEHDYPSPSSLEERNLISPQMAKNILASGNHRFVRGVNKQNNDYASWKYKIASSQFPYAIVLSCIDSRVPAELIFDCGVGDILNVRIAGNILNDDVLGSLEFGCSDVGVKAIVVMGHTGCGAVNSACIGAEEGRWKNLTKKINPAVRDVKNKMIKSTLDSPEFQNAVSRKNVQLVVNEIIQKSEMIHLMVKENKMEIFGCLYDLDSGQARFI